MRVEVRRRRRSSTSRQYSREYSPPGHEEREETCLSAASLKNFFYFVFSLRPSRPRGESFFKGGQASLLTQPGLSPRASLRVLLLGLVIFLPSCAREEPEPIEPPQVLTDSIPIIYPSELWDQQISGQTVLLLRVDPLGQVDSVAIDSTSGYPEFDSAAIRGAHGLRFIAARQGERRIPMWTRVPVRFARDTVIEMGIGGQ